MRDNNKNYLKRGEREREREREIRRIRNNIKYVGDNKKLFKKKKIPSCYCLVAKYCCSLVAKFLKNNIPSNAFDFVV